MKTWTEEMTLKFIRLRHEHAAKFTGKRNCNKLGYTFLKSILPGCEATTDQMTKKWDNLCSKYKELRNPATGTGTSQGELSAASWVYYEAMDAVLGERDIMSPPETFSSAYGMKEKPSKPAITKPEPDEDSQDEDDPGEPSCSTKKASKNTKKRVQRQGSSEEDIDGASDEEVPKKKKKKQVKGRSEALQLLSRSCDAMENAVNLQKLQGDSMIGLLKDFIKE